MLVNIDVNHEKTFYYQYVTSYEKIMRLLNISFKFISSNTKR